MFNLDGLIPKICPLAHELGEEDRTTNLCAAGLQALSSMVVIFFCLFIPLQLF